jgi:hypothetical protein
MKIELPNSKTKGILNSFKTGIKFRICKGIKMEKTIQYENRRQNSLI